MSNDPFDVVDRKLNEARAHLLTAERKTELLEM